MLAREVPLGVTNRSQAASRTQPWGSAVTDSLSLKANATSRSLESRMMVQGSTSTLSPPLVDRLADRVVLFVALNRD